MGILHILGIRRIPKGYLKQSGTLWPVINNWCINNEWTFGRLSHLSEPDLYMLMFLKLLPQALLSAALTPFSTDHSYEHGFDLYFYTDISVDFSRNFSFLERARIFALNPELHICLPAPFPASCSHISKSTCPSPVFISANDAIILLSHPGGKPKGYLWCFPFPYAYFYLVTKPHSFFLLNNFQTLLSSPKPPTPRHPLIWKSSNLKYQV